MLKIKNLKVKVEGKEILKGLNYHFEKNKIYCVMGPNGSGKSTLAYSIMGHPKYEISSVSKIIFQNEIINDLSPDKRAQIGIFLTFQTPLSLSGVTVFQLLRLALSGKKDPLTVKNDLEKYAKVLKIKKELLNRSLNDGASGGEKKKLELLQTALIDPKFLILDEIDTGVDVDTLRSIGNFLNNFKENRTIVLITHYSRILKYLNVDRVLVLNEGKIIREGDYNLVEEIEKNGYQFILGDEQQSSI